MKPVDSSAIKRCCRKVLLSTFLNLYGSGPEALILRGCVYDQRTAIIESKVDLAYHRHCDSSDARTLPALTCLGTNPNCNTGKRAGLMPFSARHLSILFVDSCYVWDYGKATTSPSLTKLGQKWPFRYHLGCPRNRQASRSV